MAAILSLSQYGYFSHTHFAEQGTKVHIWQKCNGNKVYTTGTGLTQNPEDSGYLYAQTIMVGDMRGWKLLHTFTTDNDPDPNEPNSAHMTPTEFAEAA